MSELFSLSLMDKSTAIAGSSRVKDEFREAVAELASYCSAVNVIDVSDDDEHSCTDVVKLQNEGVKYESVSCEVSLRHAIVEAVGVGVCNDVKCEITPCARGPRKLVLLNNGVPVGSAPVKKEDLL